MAPLCTIQRDGPWSAAVAPPRLVPGHPGLTQDSCTVAVVPMGPRDKELERGLVFRTLR